MGVSPCGERVTSVVLDVHDVEGAGMAIAVRDESDSPDVVTTSDHGQVT